VFIGDTLTARAELIRVDTERRRLHCATTVVNQHGDVVVDGNAVLQKDQDGA
jgi:3-hydroxybutyryl-CoA dehydratase